MTIQKTLFAGAVLFSPFFSSSGLGQQDPQAEVIGLLEMVEIPAGTFRMGCVKTENVNSTKSRYAKLVSSRSG